ncbi:GatB/YqeY domain-containing protein [Paenisporosarcina sp. TG-14]|uniref:GatB/YqeY domain-containing protein n=1 Tax=Paenisporosarcina sp. TG-14 TaxID=1231057 RepID=UPI0002EBC8BA|nr:GatB/YqeY domain-containing protein [Paenisporosarcina sp. TG-14]
MLKEKLKAEFKSAMRNKEVLKKGILTMIISNITTAEKEKGTELTEIEVLAIVQRELKQTKQALVDAEKVERQDNIDYGKEKIAIIESYLPQMMTADEIRALLVENGIGSGTNMGEAMKVIKPLVAGKADNALVSKTVKEVIA